MGLQDRCFDQGARIDIVLEAVFGMTSRVSVALL